MKTPKEQADNREIEEYIETHEGISKRIAQVLYWMKRHPAITAVLFVGSCSTTVYGVNQYEQAKEIGAVQDDMGALKESMDEDVTEIPKGDLEQLTAFISGKRNELEEITDKLELLKNDGVRFRTDIVASALQSIKDGKTATNNGKVNAMTAVNDVVNLLGSTTSVKVSGTGKNLIRRFANIDLDAFPPLKKELDLMAEQLSRLRSIMLLMEDIDLETPTNNIVANFGWEAENPHTEERLVKKIQKEKKVRSERIDALINAFRILGIFTHADDLSSAEIEKFERLGDKIDAINEVVKMGKKPTAAQKKEAKETILKMLDMFDGPPETDLEKEEIKEAQKLLAELNLLPKGYSSGVIDSTTEKAEQKMREKLSSFFVEFMVADKDKPKYSAQAKEIQEMLVHFGYLEKGEADGYLGEKSDVRAERFIEKVALEAFKDSPIDMADFVINLISESFSKDSK